jgi:hypothetical protein
MSETNDIDDTTYGQWVRELELEISKLHALLNANADPALRERIQQDITDRTTEMYRWKDVGPRLVYLDRESGFATARANSEQRSFDTHMRLTRNWTWILAIGGVLFLFITLQGSPPVWLIVATVAMLLGAAGLHMYRTRMREPRYAPARAAWDRVAALEAERTVLLDPDVANVPVSTPQRVVSRRGFVPQLDPDVDEEDDRAEDALRPATVVGFETNDEPPALSPDALVFGSPDPSASTPADFDATSHDDTPAPAAECFTPSQHDTPAPPGECFTPSHHDPSATAAWN